ncbi:hypothetical protein [Halorussus sp. MSC15.2]|uniref:hypothetical protein n=1 Tax=Halorussus sp. MSC15.2 TaxID=2283638 RepID=UPI0013D766BB|nr:hypothetical protein [Halorussus sp. MSC15.2]NEU56805.1 hypothetical protein [Halorussus sp. MSC15.2]
MPSQLSSVAPKEVAGGVVVVLVAVALVAFDYYQPSLPVAASIVLLAGVTAVSGLKPFGDTVAYHLLQAGAFAVYGLVVVVTEGLSVLPALFVVVGLVGVSNYAWKAARRGIWRTVGR